MDVKATFDVAGYVAGAALLLLVMLKRVRPAREQVWFLIFGVVLLAQSLTMPGGDQRLLGFGCLWAGWIAGQARWSQWPTARRMIEWAVLGLGAVVIADAVWRLGRPAWINPNIYGALLVLGLPFVGQRAALFIVGALLVTVSRGSICGLLLAAYLMFRQVIEAHRRSLPVIAAAGVFALLIIWRPETMLARLDHWGEALRLFAASPITGWGPGAYIDVSAIPWQNHADNALLTLLAEQGVAGMLALIPLAVVIVLKWRSSRGLGWMRVALLATLLHNLVDDTWLSPWPALLLGLNLAILWSGDEAAENTLAGAYRARGGAAAPASAVSAAVE